MSKAMKLLKDSGHEDAVVNLMLRLMVLKLNK